MRRYVSDEFNFDPRLEDSFLKEESGRKAGTDKEFNPPSVFRETAPEFCGDAVIKQPEEEKKGLSRHELLKKLLLVPVASTVAVVSIVLASLGSDPLGNDFLNVSATVLAPEDTSSTGADTTAPAGDETGPAETDDTGPADTTADVAEDTTGPEENPPEYDDSFPDLPNADPDFSGAYAWSGMGSEEYVVVDSNYIHAGTLYTDGGTATGDVPGASYDKATNTLTLTNYHGSFVDVNLMGNGFKVELVGDNSLDFFRAWGAMYGGSVIFTGSGTLTINKSNASSIGLVLECESSPSCLMIDREATVDIYGGEAIVVNDTTLDQAVYTLKPIVMTDGSGNELSLGESDGMVTVIDAEGNPAQHVLFAPAE